MTQENILRKKYEIPFVQVPREIINHPNLSWKAKGLMAYLLDKPDYWKFSISGICSQGKESETAIKSGLKELQKNGYLKITRFKNPLTKRFTHCEWELNPFSNNVSTSTFSTCGNSTSGKPLTSNTQDLSDLKKESGEREADPPKDIFSLGKVKMPMSDYGVLAQKYGKPRVDEYVKRLDDYSKQKPRKFKEYGCHKTTIEVWIRMDEERKSKTFKSNRERILEGHLGLQTDNTPRDTEKMGDWGWKEGDPV